MKANVNYFIDDFRRMLSLMVVMSEVTWRGLQFHNCFCGARLKTERAILRESWEWLSQIHACSVHVSSLHSTNLPTHSATGSAEAQHPVSQLTSDKHTVFQLQATFSRHQELKRGRKGERGGLESY